MRRVLRVVAPILLIVAVVGTGGSALAEGSYRIRADRVDVSAYPQVRIVASVVDDAGRPIRGLTVDDLIVAEEDARVGARIDLASESAPVALVLAVDVSGSMAGQPLRDAVGAIVGLVQRLGPRDEVALLTFRETVKVAQPLTADKAAVIAAARAAVANGDTAIYDALDSANAEIATAPAGYRTAVVVLSDGQDTASTTTRAQAVARARSGGHPVYMVGFGTVDAGMLDEVAAASGADSFIAPSSAQLGEVYASLAEQLVTQYSIVYGSIVPGQPGDGRRVRLQLVRAGDVLAETVISYAVPAFGQAPGAPAASAPAQPATGAAVTVPFPAVPGATVPEPGSDDLRVVVAVLGAAAIFSLFLGVMQLLVSRPAALMRTRLDRFVPRAILAVGDVVIEEPTRPLGDRLLRPAFSAVGRRLARVTPAAMLRASGEQLEQAGSPLGLGPVEFLGLRAASGIAVGAAMLAAAWILLPLPETLLAMPVGGLLLGYVVPGMALRRAVGKRKKEILRVLPSTLDMIALSVEAGLAFDGAVAQVAQRRQNALADEFRRLLVEFQMGRQRREALRELARRCGVPEVVRFMNGVMQADALGAPLSKVLGDLATELRARRRQRAEELARTAPIKMLFPLVGLIFPALFVVILGPAVPRLTALFETVGH